MVNYTFSNNELILTRDLTELDMFVRDFISVISLHTEYLIVSGYVSISTGRTRGTEDVDLLFSMLSYSEFDLLFKDLNSSGFWCYQGESSKDVFDYIQEGISVRFARKDMLFPNMECIPVTPLRKAKYFELTHPLKVKINDFSFLIPPLEFEILYKELVLGSKKDLADASHLRVIFADILDDQKFKLFLPIIQGELS